MNSKFCPLYEIKIQEGPYIVYDQGVPDAKGIFQAYNYDTNQICCAKIIEIKDDEERKKQINNHEQMSTIFHENIIRVYKILQAKTNIYVIQESCEMDLQKYLIEKSFKLNLNEILDFILQISNGYLALQNKGIIHRDLKPQNILVNRDLKQNKVIYKICDFGLLKIPLRDRITTNQQQGTPCYQAPEIMDSDYSYEADAFSFGLVLVEIMRKKTLTVGLKKDLLQYLQQNQQQRFNEEDIFEKTNDPFLVQILNMLLAYNPKNRISWNQLNEKVNKKIMDINKIPTIQYYSELNQNQLSHESNLSQSEVVLCKPQNQQQQQIQKQAPIVQQQKPRFSNTVTQTLQNPNTQFNQQGGSKLQFQQNQQQQQQLYQPFNPVFSPMSNSGQNNQFPNNNLQQVSGASQPLPFFNQKKDK